MYKDCANPRVKDIREELKKYGQVEPGKKFLEELKAKQKSLSEKQHSVYIYGTHKSIFFLS